jgi:hypothetical protein
MKGYSRHRVSEEACKCPVTMAAPTGEEPQSIPARHTGCRLQGPAVYIEAEPDPAAPTSQPPRYVSTFGFLIANGLSAIAPPWTSLTATT